MVVAGEDDQEGQCEISVREIQSCGNRFRPAQPDHLYFTGKGQHPVVYTQRCFHSVKGEQELGEVGHAPMAAVWQ